MSRDYYEVLGVPRDADTQQIKKAYRKLARELHPDVNSHDPDCEEKFKAATHAYETLCNQEKRQIYDTYGEAGLRRGAGGGPGGGAGGGFEGFGGFSDIFDAFFGGDVFGGGRGGRPSGPSRGQDMAIEVDLDLGEAAFGVKKDVTFDLVDTCRDCGGAGTKEPDSVRTCVECDGSGRVRVVRRTPFGQFVQTGVCSACGGEGRVIEKPCPGCSGSGRAYREKTLSVDVPAGISDGQRIRLTGQGAAGERGGRPGDLYVHVRVLAHEHFERDGDDILYRQDLTMVQAALGATLTVPTLDGEEEVEFAPGTQPGEVKMLKGRGVPHLRGSGRGAQHIMVNVLVPRNLNDQQRDLLRELDECCGMEHYSQKPEGFFGRLKNLFTS